MEYEGGQPDGAKYFQLAEHDLYRHADNPRGLAAH